MYVNVCFSERGVGTEKKKMLERLNVAQTYNTERSKEETWRMYETPLDYHKLRLSLLETLEETIRAILKELSNPSNGGRTFSVWVLQWFCAELLYVGNLPRAKKMVVINLY